MSGSTHISRRDFMKITTGAIGGVIAAVTGIPAVAYLVSPALREDKAGKPVIIGKLQDIPIGKPHPFSFTVTKVNGWERTAASYGGFVIRRSPDPADIIILSSRCTHLSCRVNWNDEAQGFLCPCHDAFFDIDGKVLNGPPPEPLRRFAFEVDAEGNLTITPVEIKEG
ncbi:MAG: ubiquinol-cytochrome c reductase iron-sulfur subunit [Anaerolineales bacterium]|jgi:Rieske Fe-S protein|nr:ubiquinol-cytochrome c reductase iron-sulfur subunit [Anaerolineales bacterium]